MTIDERIEALAQSLELMVSLQRDEMAKVTHNFEIVLDSIRGLERIATSHEQRIEDLEQGH